MSTTVSYYDLLSGHIIGRLTTGDSALIELNKPDHAGVCEGSFDERTHYFDVAALRMIERPLMDLRADKESIRADGVDLVTIEGLPFGPVGAGLQGVPGAIGAKVSVYGPVEDQWWQALGGSVELTVNVPGEYQVLVECWPYVVGRVGFDAA